MAMGPTRLAGWSEDVWKRSVSSTRESARAHGVVMSTREVFEGNVEDIEGNAGERGRQRRQPGDEASGDGRKGREDWRN